ncbi:hypothetical protein C7S17_7220 [Burkholderia thailandensis]|nr:hypothetical protein [Burkholderia thailandensis]
MLVRDGRMLAGVMRMACRRGDVRLPCARRARSRSRPGRRAAAAADGREPGGRGGRGAARRCARRRPSATRACRASAKTHGLRLRRVLRARIHTKAWFVSTTAC